MKDLDARLTRCFQAVFPDLPPERIPEASVDTLTDWDSVRFITLIDVVQEEFRLAFNDEEFEDLTSFSALLRYCGRHAD